MGRFDDYVPQLEIALDNWMKNKDKFNYQELLGAFDDLIYSEVDLTEDQIDTVIHYFPDVCLAGNETRSELSMRVSNKMIDLLKPNVLLKLLAKKDGEQILAWFCCEHAITYTAFEKVEMENTFKNILDFWTGELISKDIKPTLDVVVGVIYGKTCWDLYGYDIKNAPASERPADIISTIVRNRLPFEFKNHQQEKSTESIEPPDTMI